jgi:hypothetical protein
MGYVKPTEIPSGWRVLTPEERKERGDKFWTINHWAYCSALNDLVGSCVTVIRKIDANAPDSIIIKSNTSERVKDYLKKIQEK